MLAGGKADFPKLTKTFKLIKGLYYTGYDGCPHIYDPNECVDTVIHVVNGVITEAALKSLYDKNLKLLVLGFKTKGRGVEYEKNASFAENQKWLYDNIEEVAKHFKAIVFDILALKQLEMKRFLSDAQWENTFMGEYGLHSMYVDLVKGEYGI